MVEAVMGKKSEYWRSLVGFFVDIPAGVKEANQHHYIILSIITYFAFVAHTSWIPIFGILGVRQLAIFNCLSSLSWFVAIRLNRRGLHYTSLIIGIIEIWLHQALCVVVIGWGAGFQYYILALPFGIYLMPHGRNFIKATLSIICLLIFSLLDYFFRASVPIVILNPIILNIFNYSNLIVFVALASFACYFFNAKVFSAEKALRKVQKKVENAYSLLSKYVAPQLADTISEGQIDSIWKHNRKKLTLFFSDIKDFTAITDSMEPEDMAGMLNEYLTEMNLIINRHGGTLAQVIGDALYVFFGAPESNTDKDNAVRCVKMAIEMQNKMKSLNEQWYENGIEEKLLIRCGINTGMVTVGGYGSSERKEYTAMGMQTNIAARLEQSCEPGSILISHTTWALVKDEISCTEKEKISVKGLRKSIKAYCVATEAFE
jgi:class 3 adenylate cyclase